MKILKSFRATARVSMACLSPRKLPSARADAGLTPALGAGLEVRLDGSTGRIKGSVQLAHDPSEIVTAKVRAATPEDERKLLSSFLGFVDRHCGDHVDTITIQYR
jgi:hypothetical protein